MFNDSRKPLLSRAPQDHDSIVVVIWDSVLSSQCQYPKHTNFQIVNSNSTLFHSTILNVGLDNTYALLHCLHSPTFKNFSLY